MAKGGKMGDFMLNIPASDITLQEKIGQGGFGAVHKAWHKRLKEQVAVKVLLVENTNVLR